MLRKFEEKIKKFFTLARFYASFAVNVRVLFFVTFTRFCPRFDEPNSLRGLNSQTHN